MKIELISCVSKKLVEAKRKPVSAKELYISPLFEKAWAYAERMVTSDDRIYILSAKYGLLSPEKEIKWYDETLYKQSVEKRRQWADEVLKNLRKEGCDLENDEFILLAGDIYCKYLLGKNGIRNAHQVYKENNLKGIGYILKYLSEIK